MRAGAWIVVAIVALLIGWSCQKAAYDECRSQGHGRAYCWQITG